MTNTDRSNVRPIGSGGGTRGRPTKAESASREQAPDPFGLDDGKKRYSLDEFYVGSTNEFNHSESFNVKVPDRINMAIRQFISDDGLPAYRSIQDFVRDACAHRIHYLVNTYPGEGPVDPMLTAWSKMIEITGRLNLVTSMIADRDRTIRMTIEDLRTVAHERDPEMIEPIVEAAIELAAGLPEESAGAVWDELARMGVSRPEDVELAVIVDVQILEADSGFES